MGRIGVVGGNSAVGRIKSPLSQLDPEKIGKIQLPVIKSELPKLVLDQVHCTEPYSNNGRLGTRPYCRHCGRKMRVYNSGKTKKCKCGGNRSTYWFQIKNIRKVKGNVWR